jgi:hypothetical protein
MLHIFLSFSVVSSFSYHYLSTVQINPFIPCPSHSATDSRSCRFTVKNFSPSALAGGGGFFFHLAPNPLSAALGIGPVYH